VARSRNIKPGLFKNEILGVADPLYTLLFEGLWLLADRDGRLEDRPLRIKAETFPYREGLNIEAMLDWLQANGFIKRYQVGQQKCIEIISFGKHQNPHKNEPASVLPSPDEIEAKTEENKTTPDKIGTTPEIIGSARADSLNLIPDSLNIDSESPPITAPPPEKPKIEFQEIANLYNKILGETLREVRDLTDQRKKHIKARIADDTAKRSSLDWWRTYFEFVSESDLLMGRAPARGESGQPWQADFDWLINPNNMAKIRERKYHRE
jgi:hypothetical protein